jgi:hypothetical protein
LLEIRRSDDAKNDLYNETLKNQLARIEEGEKKVFEEQVRSRNVQGSITKRKRDRKASQKQDIICGSPAGFYACSVALDASGAFSPPLKRQKVIDHTAQQMEVD